jgi:hypothetical protein
LFIDDRDVGDYFSFGPELCRLGPTEKVLPEDGERIQSLKRYVLKYKQDGVLDTNGTMDNVKKHYICSNEPSSKTTSI